MITFSQNTEYYYYKGQKLYLDISTQFLHISTNNSFDESLLGNLGFKPFEFYTETTQRSGEFKKNTTLEFQTTPNQVSYNTMVTTLKGISGVETVSPYYSQNGSEPRGTSSFFYVKLKPTTSLAQLETLVANSAYITITGINNNTSNNYIIDPSLAEIAIDVSSYSTGTYVITLICEGQVYSSQNLLIN